MVQLLALLVLSAFLSQAQVIGVGNFIHNVADLDRSVAFYRDILGMELQRPPSAFQAGPEVPSLYNAVGGQYRVASAQIANSPMRAELAEFKDVERKPVRPRFGDPGSSVLVLAVGDLEPVLERIKSAGLKTLKVTRALPQGRRSLIVEDPDGFFVEVVEAEAPLPQQAGNFTDMSFAFFVRDGKAMGRVLSALGLAPGTSGDFEVTTANFSRPFHLRFIESKGASAAQSMPRDPGSPVLRLLVKDASAAVDALSRVGVKVASAKGEIVTLPGGPTPRRAAILRAPDNLFIQVLQ